MGVPAAPLLWSWVEVSCLLLWSAVRQGAFFMLQRSGGLWSALCTADTLRRVPA